MIRLIAILFTLMTTQVTAQNQEVVIDVGNSIEAEAGALLRGLDRINGVYTDIELRPG